ncbi:MAG: SGNH/GDSL hydrolase family protein [Actinomycetota bacterium]|nr:SGNH/GDSL hydrolase family protein [Actinomycetota bacterium]
MQNDFSNLSGRPPGRFVTVAALALPGVRSVQRQVAPFADEWSRRNAEVLATSTDAAGQLWVALGDSMTLGIGASAPDQGWVGQLAAGMTGWRVLNLGINGGRVRDVLDRQLPVLESLARQPDLVTLLIGSNDLMSPRLRKLLTADMATLLERLPAGTVVGNQPGGYAGALRVNKLIDDAVAQRGLVLAELRDPRTRNWRNKLAADRFHPNDRGYHGMAEVFGEAIQRAIS